MKEKVSQDEFAELLRPKLKLFLSVDIVGSTRYKQRDREQNSQEWLTLFWSFFTTFPEEFRRQVAELIKGDPEMKLRPVNLWKTLGDELIFTVELTERDQVSIFLKAFALALRRAADNWHNDAKTPAKKELHLKGACWLAGFPVGNAEMPMDYSQNGDLIDPNDYIGPLIDTGFRIKEHASPRKLVLSVELAYFLVSTNNRGLRLFYEGESVLKGVLKEKPYPVIWFELDPESDGTQKELRISMNRLRDTLTGRTKADPETLRNYLRLWFQAAGPSLVRPFIVTDPFDEFVPYEAFPQKLDEISTMLRQVLIVDDGEQKGEEQKGSKNIPAFLKRMLINLPLEDAPQEPAEADDSGAQVCEEEDEGKEED